MQKMKNRAINALVEIGMPADIKGFEYIVDMMVLYQDEKERHSGIVNNYNSIAEKRNSTTSRVERAIRHAFGVAVSRGNAVAVEKYLSFDNTTNGNLLHLLYLRLEQEAEEEE